MNMSKSRDIQAKMPSPKAIFYAFWLVTVKVLNSYAVSYRKPHLQHILCIKKGVKKINRIVEKSNNLLIF